jgi:hypothetical protein
MSEAKHTPGPWQVAGTRHSGDLKIGPNTRLHMVGPDGDAVSAVFFDMKTGIGLADARLIAAAPDLLEACRLLIGADGEGMLFSERVNKARLAIAKAEGRS